MDYSQALQACATVGAMIRKHLQVKEGSKAGLVYLQLWDVYKLEGHEVL